MIVALPSLGGWILALGAAGLSAALLHDRSRRREATARAAHELRGPLQAIGLAIEYANRGGTGTTEHWSALELVLGRARLALDDLQAGQELAMPRPAPLRRRTQDSAGPASLQCLDARSLLEDAQRAATPRAAAAETEIQIEWEGAGAAVRAPRVRIAQALANLVANAIEHGGGPIVLRGRQMGTTVRFEVCDHGDGLPAPVCELAGRARGGHGRRGRGLAIAQAIAQAHGGRLAAAPSQHGGRLVLELPAWGAVQAAARPSAARQSGSQQ
jgi:signal transduction histidine kinase